LSTSDTTHPSSLSLFPAEQVRYAGQCASIDADRVAAYLSRLGYKPTPENPIALPRGLLLDFDAIQRMRAWEEAGINVHRQAGLPSAEEADIDLTILCIASGRKIPHSYVFGTLASKVFVPVWNRFVWEGLNLVGADIVLPFADNEDEMIDAIAEYLWNSRPNSN